MATNAPFAFLPRVVSKHAKPWPGISRFSPSPSPSPDLVTDSEPEEDGQGDDEDDEDEPNTLDKGKGKEKPIELAAHSKQSILTQDIASLVSLALADYNLWLDGDLRCKLDAGLNDETSPDGAGCTSPISFFACSSQEST